MGESIKRKGKYCKGKLCFLMKKESQTKEPRKERGSESKMYSLPSAHMHASAWTFVLTVLTSSYIELIDFVACTILYLRRLFAFR